ncbi:MAG TPA: hypothetical protein VES89_02190, partial [Candidatus Competibacteraceae bacterium]|nr:hypothetical protein [Candidatus Competibacteraceae bacterium]
MTLPQETFTALEAEVAAIVGVLMEALSDPDVAQDPTVAADSLGRYTAHVERIGVLAGLAGLAGLRLVCDCFQDQLVGIIPRLGSLEEAHRELLEEWPALIIGYLESPEDPGASEVLVGYLRNPAWPAPLSGSEAAHLLARLAAPWVADSAEEAVVSPSEMMETMEPQVALIEGPEMVEAAPDAQPEVAEEAVIAPAMLLESEKERLLLAMADDETLSPPASLGEASSSSELVTSASCEESVTASVAASDTTIAAGTASTNPLGSTLDETAPTLAETAEAEPTTGWLEFPALLEEAAIPVEAVAESREESAEPETEAEPALVEIVRPEAEAEVVTVETEAESPDVETAWLETEAESPEVKAALLETDAELSELEATPAGAEVDPLEREAALMETEPESATGIEETPAFSESEQELVELLQAEIGVIAAAAANIRTVATDPDSEAEARSEALLGYAEEIARLAEAAEAMGFSGLQQACIHLNDNLLALASQSRALTGGEYELIAAWPARTMRYLQTVTDRDACQALAANLQDTGWPIPLPVAEAGSLVDLLIAPTLAVPEAEIEARPREALPEEVSLALPEDVNPELLDSLLQELPGQTAELSAAIQRLAGGQGVLQDVEVA